MKPKLGKVTICKFNVTVVWSPDLTKTKFLSQWVLHKHVDELYGCTYITNPGYMPKFIRTFNQAWKTVRQSFGNSTQLDYQT